MRLAAPLLALLLLAGCVAPAGLQSASAPDGDVAAVLAALSPRLGDLPILHEVLDVETRHGLVNVDVYRPETPGGEKVPVILVASPYNNEHSPLGGGKRGDDNWISLPLYNFLRDELMPRGYALAQMDVLGTRNSGGCMGIMNQAERQATADVVDWLGAQDWTNGNVGMIGKSYLGLSQLGAAVENPEHLRAIVPIAPPTHDYAYHYYNGVPYLFNHATQAAYYGGYSLPPFDGDPATYGPRYVERVPCAPEALAASAYTLGDYSARWQERDYRPLVPQMRDDIAVFFIAGHQDWNVKPDHPLDVFNAIPGPKMGLFGQWGHDYPNINNFDEDAFSEREDWYYTLHRWFDHWLKGIDTGLMREAEACPVQTQDSEAAWRCVDAFPPAPARTLALHPQADGALGDAPGSGTVQYQDAVRSGMGLATGAGAPGTRKFRLEVTEDLRIVGAPNVTMRVSTTSPVNTFLTAALGVERNGVIEEFTWGFLSLRHRDGLEAGKPVAPGTAYDVNFLMYPVDHVLRPGDVLVLTLRGDSNGARVEMLPNPTPGVQTVDLAGTRLDLPLLGLDGAFTPLAEADLPKEYARNDRRS